MVEIDILHPFDSLCNFDENYPLAPYSNQLCRPRLAAAASSVEENQFLGTSDQGLSSLINEQNSRNC